jgi:hypothetical protein
MKNVIVRNTVIIIVKRYMINTLSNVIVKVMKSIMDKGVNFRMKIIL